MLCGVFIIMRWRFVHNSAVVSHLSLYILGHELQILFFPVQIPRLWAISTRKSLTSNSWSNRYTARTKQFSYVYRRRPRSQVWVFALGRNNKYYKNNIVAVITLCACWIRRLKQIKLRFVIIYIVLRSNRPRAVFTKI